MLKVLVLIFVCIQTNSYSQKVRTVKGRQAPKITSPKIVKPKLDIEKLIDQSGGTSLAFTWSLKADTLVLPFKTIVAEVIDLSSKNATVVRSFIEDTLKMQIDTDFRGQMIRTYQQLLRCEVNFNKDVAILTDSKTNQKEFYKIILDSNRKKILRIQNQKNKCFYDPVVSSDQNKVNSN
jgi:hypothetical protein